jgi:hypothetical protein
MVTALTLHPAAEHPRISANQLGEFAFASPSEKSRILHDQKFGNNSAAPYYHSALSALLRSFEGGQYDLRNIAASRQAIEALTPETRQGLARRDNNAEMLKRFAEIEPLARPPGGAHQVVHQNASMLIGGVTVSVRPEIITQCPDGLFCFTKLRFSKSKVSEDSSEVILLILMKYGQQLSHDSYQLDPERTRLVDCFSKTIFLGHKIPRFRESQLAAAVAEIEKMWPRIQRKPSKDEDRAAAR